MQRAERQGGHPWMKQPPAPSSTKNARSSSGASQVMAPGRETLGRPEGIDKLSTRPRADDPPGGTKV